MTDLFNWKPTSRPKSMKDALGDEPFELPSPPKAKAFKANGGPGWTPKEPK